MTDLVTFTGRCEFVCEKHLEQSVQAPSRTSLTGKHTTAGPRSPFHSLIASHQKRSPRPAQSYRIHLVVTLRESELFA